MSNVVQLEERHKWQELGRGLFSVVWKAYCSHNNGYMAVKEVKKGDLLPEVERLSLLLDHDHILKIKVVDIGRQRIINEFCSYSLQLLRDTLGQDFIPWPQCRLFIEHILGGLEFLHDNGIVHGGLRPTNVMVNDRFICKIADIGPAGSGHSVWASNAVLMTSHAVYASPRLLMDPSAQPEKTDDIYCCAMLLYKMITNADILNLGERAAHGSILENLKVWVVTKNLRPDIRQIHSGSQRAPPLVETIIRTCWDRDQYQRKPAKCWVKALREDNEAKLTSEIIKVATVQLEQMLRKNEFDGGATCDRGDVPLNLSPVADEFSRLSAQDGTDVRIIDGSDLDAMRCYNLTQHRSYRLNFDKSRGMILFEDSSSVTTSISIRKLKSAKKMSDKTVVLNVAVSGSEQIHSLRLSASSAEKTIRGLKELAQTKPQSKRETSKDNGVQQQEELRSSDGTLINGHPADSAQSMRSDRQPTGYPSVPNGRQPMRPDPVTSRPPAQQVINVNIMKAEKVFNYGAAASAPIDPGPPPYSISALTESTEMISMEDMINLQGHVVAEYEAVGRLLGLGTEMEAFKRDHKSITEASYQLLKTWVDHNGCNATKMKLAHVLYETGLYEAAKMLLPSSSRMGQPLAR